MFRIQNRLEIMKCKYTRSAWIIEFIQRSWIRCQRKIRSLAPVSTVMYLVVVSIFTQWVMLWVKNGPVFQSGSARAHLHALPSGFRRLSASRAVSSVHPLLSAMHAAESRTITDRSHTHRSADSDPHPNHTMHAAKVWVARWYSRCIFKKGWYSN